MSGLSLKARLAATAYLLKRLVLKGEVQRFAPSGAPALRPSAPPEQGIVDRVVSGRLLGWARRIDAPEELVRVDIYCGDEFIGRASCNLPRADLATLPGCDPGGRHGFAFPLPEQVRRLGGRLRVVAAQSGLELAGSPIEAPAQSSAPAEEVHELLTKVWHAEQPYPGVTTLAQIQSAYGDRLAVLCEVDPQATDVAWPVTRIMSHYNACAHGGRLDAHGSEAYSALLTAAGGHFAPTRAGLPMDARQVEALTRPTGWLLDGRVRSNMLIDVFARSQPSGGASDPESVAELLTAFLVEVLAKHRLPIELLGRGARAFLAEPAGERARFEAALLKSPLMAGRPAPALATAARLAAEDLGLQELVSGDAPVTSARPADRLRDGVAILTGDYAESGLLVNARQSLAALTALGVDTHVGKARLPGRGTQLTDGEDPMAPSYATAILHVTPDDAVELVLRLPPEQIRARLIGFFVWESETLPDRHRLGTLLVDEIWTASRYCEDVFLASGPRGPVHVVGHAVQRVDPDPDFDARAWAGVGPADFVFLFHFDAHAWITRKNPTGLVRAFRQAFAPDQSDVRLVIKVRNAQDWNLPQWRSWWTEFYEEAAQDDRILVVRGDLSNREMASLTRSADAFVSLHRSEGFGYGLAEAMLAGKPLIATAYGGSLDFTLPEETLLVSARKQPIRQGEFLYSGPGHVWGDPDLGEAAVAMTRLYEDRPLAERLGLRGRERIMRDFSLDALSKRYADCLAAPAEKTSSAGRV